MKTLAALALLSLPFLAAPATADVHKGSSWLEGTFGAGVGLAGIDLDDETGVVSVIVDTQGVSDLVGGRLIDQAGATLCTFGVAAPDVVFGTAALAPAQQLLVRLGQARIVVDTLAQPGQISGPVSAHPTSHSYPFTTGQAAHEGAAYGTGFLMIDQHGTAGLSGQLRELQGVVASIELWRGAWYGQTGTLAHKITSIGHPTPALTTFDLFLTSAPTDLLRDLKDGLCYVLVRTSAFPDGELRGQIRALTLGDSYCTGRRSSVSFAGARLAIDGSPLAADDALRLRGTDLPPGKPVLPIVGVETGHVFAPAAFGGLLCVAGGGVARLSHHAGIATPQGTFDVDLDLAGVALGGGALLEPGRRLDFQLWYRDPAGPTPTNLSSAVSIVVR